MEHETAITLKEAARRLGLSYRTVFDRRMTIGFRLPGSRVWRVWPSQLAELSQPRNNVIRLSTRVTGEDPCRSEKGPTPGGLTSHRQAVNELDAVLARATANRRRSTMTG